MKYFIGNKVYDFSEEELNRFYLDEGTEATCYKLGDTVLKIHHEFPNRDRKSTRLNSSHAKTSRMPSSA